MSKSPSQKLTYCNPLPLPNYQRGKACTGENFAAHWGWQHPDKRHDFREMADPTVIYWQNRWYLFPSCGMLWHSGDMVNWLYHPIEPFDIGYAPTVVIWTDPQGQEWLLLTASGSEMYRARNPFGPWESIGPVCNEKGQPTQWFDPMLFQDDDGALYCYNGIGPDGIYVVRLQDDKPSCWAGPRQHCFGFDPSHEWERGGEWNENSQKCMMEGAWITKHDGRYYLQYSAPGTEWTTYAVGCYVGETPLGPWRYQRRNPVLRAPRGSFVNGTGHHSLVEGPSGPNGKPTLWCFYTTLVRIEHAFERRIGMDPAGFDANGELFVNGPTETPQFAPGISENPELANDAGLIPLSVHRFCCASSSAPGHTANFAFDGSIRTWWEATSEDKEPWLRIDLEREWLVSASRLCFADRGLDYAAGNIPSTRHYILEGSFDGERWFTVCDQSENQEEKHIAYDTFKPTRIRYARLRFLNTSQGLVASLWQWTLFGNDEIEL